MSDSVSAALISKFLLGLGQKCIVAALKKWKENADRIGEREIASAIREVELSKSIATKIEQKVTVSLQTIRLSDTHLQILLALENDPFLKNELGKQLAESQISPQSIVELFNRQKPELGGADEELLRLAAVWLDAIDKSIAESPEVTQLLTIQAHRQVRSDLAGIGDQLLKAEFRSETRQEDIVIQLSRIEGTLRGLSPLRADTPPETPVPDHLKTILQRRFDRARHELIEGSLVAAEREFRALIEELESIPQLSEVSLLYRSYINLGSSIWEQNRPSEAVVWHEKASTILPDDWRSTRSRALILIEQGDKPGAILLFRALAQIKPDESEHVCNAAWLLRSIHKDDEALAILEAKRFEDTHYYTTLSLVYLNLKRYSEAEEAARKAATLSPGSEGPLSALSFALGFPILASLVNEGIPRFPSEEGRSRLFEAIDAAELAKSRIRQRGRASALGDILVNLAPFYAMVGKLDQALEAGREALQFMPEEPMVHRNLWCTQMRLGRHREAVDSGKSLERFGEPIDGWVRKAQALLAIGEHQEILTDWACKQGIIPGLANEPDALAVVARAMSASHKTKEAVALLDESICRLTDSTRLRLERGLILEDLGKIPDATMDLEAAEAQAQSHGSHLGQVLVDCAMFRYRRGDWKGAGERLARLGAASTHHPLFDKYLTCLFNDGEYRRCLALCESAIASTPDVNEEHYALAARCCHFSDNLPRSRELLNKLVSRSGPREHENRKLLGWVYWRLDELEEAHDVLAKANVLKPRDCEVLILLSAVSTALKQHGEALNFACDAVDSAPNDLRSHAAMVRAAFSCPRDTRIEKRHLDSHFRSLAFLQRHEAKIVQTIPIEEDFRSILKLLKKRSQYVRRVEQHFHNKRLPIGWFANRLGRSEYTIWAALLRHPSGIRMATGTTAEQHNEQIAASPGGPVSVDLFGLLTLRFLNFLTLLPRLFSGIYVHASHLDEVLEEIRDLERNPKQGSICSVDGRIVMHERTPEEVAELTQFLLGIRDFLKSDAVTLTGLDPQAMGGDTIKVLVENCGIVSIAPLLIAKDKGAALYSDDVVVRNLGQMDTKLPNFCSQALLRVAVARGLITAAEYQDAIIKLIENNYQFVSEDAGTIRRAYERADGQVTPLSLTLINRVNDRKWDARSCLPLLADFAIFVWRSSARPGADPREKWMAAIWEAVAKADKAEDLLMGLSTHLAVLLVAQPDTYFGIVGWAARHAFSFQAHRDVLRFTMEQSVTPAIALAESMYPGWPTLAQEWRLHARLFQVLRSQAY